jgi:hypothetical protein
MDKPTFWNRIAPAFVLMWMAMLMVEALPGATRPSVYVGVPFVIALELALWGGFAVFGRELVRRRTLGWLNLLLLGIACGVAEEILIQQTSIAPVVFKLKGVEYARALGVNYLYLAWALVYECVFSVLVPVAIVEFLYREREKQGWLSRGGAIGLSVFFVLGAVGAWFAWTQYARVNVFKAEPYTPLVMGIAAIALLVFLAIGPTREWFARARKPLATPPVWLLGVLGALFATYLWALVMLAFGIAPQFPSWVAMGATLFVYALALWLVPRWSAHERWTERHRFGLVVGAAVGNMAAAYVAFLYASPLDFWGKTILDVSAVVLLAWLGVVVWRRAR